MKTSKIIISLAVILAVWFFLLAHETAISISTPTPSPAPGLFASAPFTNLSQPQGDYILRSRPVTINEQELQKNLIRLNLFPDASMIVVRDRIERNASGSLSWIGHVQGMEGTIVVLVMGDDRMTGIITTPERSYRVVYLGDGVHAVQQVDSAHALPPVAGVLRDYLVPEIAARKNAGATAVSAADDGSVIDVMVVYTDDAADATILDEIEGAVAWTNQTYINSDIAQRLWLVHAMEVQYDEEDPALHGGNRLNWDLNHITNPNDGVIDNVHPARNQYHADLTMFIVSV